MRVTPFTSHTQWTVNYTWVRLRPWQSKCGTWLVLPPNRTPPRPPLRASLTNGVNSRAVPHTAVSPCSAPHQKPGARESGRTPPHCTDWHCESLPSRGTRSGQMVCELLTPHLGNEDKVRKTSTRFYPRESQALVMKQQQHDRVTVVQST